jgi:diphthamide biosynthesis protein 7
MATLRTSIHCCSIETVPFLLQREEREKREEREDEREITQEKEREIERERETKSEREIEYVCGMYELNEETSLRKGALAICIGGEKERDCNQDAEGKTENNPDERILYEREMESGVLDMKFAENILACSLANGKIALFDYHDRTLSDLTECSSGESEGLALSLSWDHPTSERSKIAVSTQMGSLLFYTLLPTGLELTSTISEAHLLQGEKIPAWIVAYSVHNDSIFLSGGDDCCMKLWDLRVNTTSSTYSSSKHYSAGVTSAQWHPTSEHIFAVGSYDGTMKIWDRRSLRSPLFDMDTGGGVWRIKWKQTVDSQFDYLAVASMQAGSGIYRWDSHLQKLSVVNLQSDDSPNRLIYGIDWLSLRSHKEMKDSCEKEIEWSVVTCSFYDNLIQRWNSRRK